MKSERVPRVPKDLRLETFLYSLRKSIAFVLKSRSQDFPPLLPPIYFL